MRVGFDCRDRQLLSYGNCCFGYMCKSIVAELSLISPTINCDARFRNKVFVAQSKTWLQMETVAFDMTIKTSS